MQFFKDDPLIIGEYEAAQSNTVPAVELRLVAQIPKHVAHDEGALDTLGYSVPTRADRPNQNLTVAFGSGSELRELCADRRTVPHLL